MVFGRDFQKSVDAFLETWRILLPGQIVQKHAHCIQSDRLRPSEFLIDALWVKRIRLPHLQLIDCVRGNVVAAYQPGPLQVPVRDIILAPASFLRPTWGCKGEYN